MHTTPRNARLLAYWTARKDGDALPRLSVAELLADTDVAAHMVVEFRGPDGEVRFAHCGQEVTKLVGLDLTGLPVAETFPANERAGIRTLLANIFRAPKIVLSHSTVETLDEQLLQGEMMLLPTVVRRTGELIYLCGMAEINRADGPATRDGHLRSRSMLSRKIIDPLTLEEMESPFAYPSATRSATPAA